MEREEVFYKGRKITEGTIMVAGSEETLPLKYTEVRASIIGMLADVRVIQKFHNELDKNIEAVYVFPLPHESAVNDLEIKIGERIIRSEIKERDEARKTYEEARDDMQHAALLEQERPNIFTISVANIEPGQEILVTLRYHETVKYEDGEYELVFPMTITPRYIPESSSVTDAERISPPIASPKRLAGREVNIFINLEAGFEIGEVNSTSHLLFVQEKSKSHREIQLAKEGELPNKDFILKYSTKGEQPETSLSFHREENKTGTFMLHLTPKVDYGPDEMIKREMIFVLDRSGSMSYGPMDQAKKALKACLRTLRAGDCFSVITFDNCVEYLLSNSLEFNDQNLHNADTFIDATEARGGTEILLAMQYALNVPVNKEYIRQIIFLTDGAVGNEEEALKEIQKILGKARIFTFGIGPSVNRYLLDKMAQTGRGTAQYIAVNQDIEEIIQKFSNQTAFPILCDMSLEWKDAKVADLYPAPIPDLYFGQVLCLLGRFYSSGKATAMLKGLSRAGEFKQELEVNLPEKLDEYGIIETIWARKRIDTLLDKEREKPKEKHSIRDEILGLAMKYHLMSPYTSLVAVEKEGEKEKKKEEIIRIDVPQLLPEGLEYNAFTQQGSSPAGAPPHSPLLRSLSPAPVMCAKLMAPTPVSAPFPASPPSIPMPQSQKPGAIGGALRGEALLGTDASLSIGGVFGGAVDGVKSLISGTMKALSPAKKSMKKRETNMPVKMDSAGKESEKRAASFAAPMKDAVLADYSVSFSPSGKIRTQEQTSDMLELTLKWLARNQSAEGYWSKDGDMEKRIVATALGVLAFTGQGHTNKTGNYMPQLGKSISYIQSNLDKLSGLSLATAALVFIELYNNSAKKKEKSDAEKAIKKLLDNRGNYKTPIEQAFAALAEKAAKKAGLEGEFTDIDKWMTEATDGAKKLTGGIITIEDLFSGFISVLSGKEELSASFLSLLADHHINYGSDSGSISIQGLVLMTQDVTSIGAFILSWPTCKLAAR